MGVAAGLALAVAASLSVGQVAQAADGRVGGQVAKQYPPSTKLSLVANRASVAVSQKVKLSAFHAGPGCSVKFTFGSQHAFRVAHSGKAAATFTSTATSGLIHATASTYNCPYHETAHTTVKASSPTIKLPSHAVAKHWFRVTASRFPAKREIHIRVYNSHFSKTVAVETSAGGSASPLFKVPSSGTYVVVATSGSAHASTVLKVHNS